MVRAVSAVQIDLGADGLTGRPVPLHHLPPVGQRLDEDEAAAVFVEGVRRRYVTGFRRVGLRTGVTDLDTDAACREGHPQLEVPAGDPAVGDRVGGQLGDDHGDDVGGRTAVRDAPGMQLVQSEVPGEAAPRGVALRRWVSGTGMRSIWRPCGAVHQMDAAYGAGAYVVTGWTVRVTDRDHLLREVTCLGRVW